jgi:TonB family protein
VLRIDIHRTRSSWGSVTSGRAAASRGPAGLYVPTILIVVAFSLGVIGPDAAGQDRQGVSQAGEKTELSSDPCAEFHDSSPQVSVAQIEENKDGGMSLSTHRQQSGAKVSISPQTDRRLAVGYSRPLAAIVTGTSDTRVEWGVMGPGCSGSACGFVEGDVYVAPVVVPNPPFVRLTATARADAQASDSITVCIAQPGPQWNLSSATGAVRGAAKVAAKEATRKNPASTYSGPVEITTDTLGVNFGPYLQGVVHDVKQNWYSLIPPTAMPPVLRRGTVVLEFIIMKSGKIAGLRYSSGSGYVELDRAAFGGVTASSPFPPLPAEFKGQYLGLRMTFKYNPGGLLTSGVGAVASSPVSPVNPAVTTSASQNQKSAGSASQNQKLAGPASQNQRLTGVLPLLVNVPAGASLQFSPVLNGVTDLKQFPITWSVAGCTAGVDCGSVSQTGLYTAPSTVPRDPRVIVQAKLDADVHETVSAVVSILPAKASK